MLLEFSKETKAGPLPVSVSFTNDAYIAGVPPLPPPELGAAPYPLPPPLALPAAPPSAPAELVLDSDPHPNADKIDAPTKIRAANAIGREDSSKAGVRHCVTVAVTPLGLVCPFDGRRETAEIFGVIRRELLIRIAAVSTLVIAPVATDGCGSDSADARAPGGSGVGGNGGTISDSGSGDVSTGGTVNDAAPDVPLGPCAACGAGRSTGACTAKVSACKANSECADILDCVYDKTPGCPLGETGAACVAECVRAYCFSSESAKLFYAAELCSYCDPKCSTPCGDYCAGFVVDAASAECVTLDGSLETDSGEIDANLGGASGGGGAAGISGADGSSD